MPGNTSDRRAPRKGWLLRSGEWKTRTRDTMKTHHPPTRSFHSCVLPAVVVPGFNAEGAKVLAKGRREPSLPPRPSARTSASSALKTGVAETLRPLTQPPIYYRADHPPTKTIHLTTLSTPWILKSTYMICLSAHWILKSTMLIGLTWHRILKSTILTCLSGRWITKSNMLTAFTIHQLPATNAVPDR